MLAYHFSFFSCVVSLRQWFDRHNSKWSWFAFEFEWVQYFLVACCNDCHVFFIVLSCLLVIFHSTVYLYLFSNSLTGTIPTEIALMSNLCKSSVVWLLVVMIVLSCVFHCTLMLAYHFSFFSCVVSLRQWFDRHNSKWSWFAFEFEWVQYFLLACCNDCHVFFIVLSCLLVIFHSTAFLDLSYNSLMGTIPSQLALLSNLCESSVVCLLVVMIVLCVFHCTLMLACHFSFYRSLGSLRQYFHGWIHVSWLYFLLFHLVWLHHRHIYMNAFAWNNTI
jgi:hypothetical protein